jgi:hypothetical protein
MIQFHCADYPAVGGVETLYLSFSVAYEFWPSTNLLKNHSESVEELKTSFSETFNFRGGRKLTVMTTQGKATWLPSCSSKSIESLSAALHGVINDTTLGTCNRSNEKD